MAKSANQKLKLLYLAELFKKQTDSEHYVTMKDIIDYLEDRDITAERKSIYTDIEALRAFGYKIKGEKMGREYKYNLISEDFSSDELELLANAVNASACLPEGEAGVLVNKLSSLTSDHNSINTNEGVIVKNRVKSVDERAMESLRVVNAAIKQNKKIDFNYLQWNSNKELVPRKNALKENISPWAVVYDAQVYYLLAYDNQGERFKYYQLDKMDKAVINPVGEREGGELFAELDKDSLYNERFALMGGDTCTVKLECKSEAVGIVIDKFGRDISFSPTEEGNFTFITDVVPGKMFFGWLFAMGGDVKVISPKSVRKAFRDRVKEISKLFQ